MGGWITIVIIMPIFAPIVGMRLANRVECGKIVLALLAIIEDMVDIFFHNVDPPR